MIYDTLQHASAYYRLGSLIEAGLRLLAQTDFDSLADGRYEIEDGLYMTISSYTTKPADEAHPESHKEYLDIQYLVAGREMIGVAPLSDMEAATNSDVQKDLYFYKGATRCLPLERDRFMIFFPQDAHAPCIAVDTPSPVRKVVVKVRAC